MRIGKIVRSGAWILLAITSVLATGAFLLDTPWGHERVRRILVAQSARLLAGQLEIKKLTGSVWHGVTLEGVRLVQAGRPVVTVDDIKLRYSLWGFLRGSIDLDDVALNRPVLAIVEDERGWNVTMMLASRSSSAGAARPLRLRHLSVTDGFVHVAPIGAAARDLSAVTFDGTLSYVDGRLRVTANEGHASDEQSGVAIQQIVMSATLDRDRIDVENLDLRTEAGHVTGYWRLSDRRTQPIVDADLVADPISIPEVARYVPSLASIPIVARARVKAHGAWTALGADWDVLSPHGTVTGTGTFDLGSPTRTVTGTVSVADLDLAAFTGKASFATRLTGSASVTGSLPPAGWPQAALDFQVDAKDVAIRDYRATDVRARGRYDASGVKARGTAAGYGAAATFDLAWRSRTGQFTSTGDATHVDLRNLPAAWDAPRFTTMIAARYALAVDAGSWGLETTLAHSTIEGAGLQAGTTARFEYGAGTMTYQTKGRVTALDLDRILQVSRRTAPDARFQSRIDAGFELQGRGPMASLVDQDATATISMEPSTIGGMKVDQLQIGATIAERALTADIAGGLEDVSVAGFAAAIPQTRGNGRVRAHVLWHDISAPIQPSSFDGTIAIDLDASTVAGVAIDHANIAAAADQGLVTVSRAEIDGAALKASASGTLALGDRGESALTYTIDALDLATLGTVVSQPLSGSARFEGRVTGPRVRTTIAGTVTTQEFRREAMSALTLTADYTAVIPDAAIAQAQATSTFSATFVQAGGMKIDRLSGTLKYADSTLDVAAKIEQPDRIVTADAGVMLAPDRRQVQVRQLTIDTKGTAWQLAGSNAIVRYGPEVSVSGFVLTSGNARITIDGTLPAPAPREGAAPHPLTLTASNVALHDIDALWLGTGQLLGQIDGTAVVSGTTGSPEVTADFHVTGGRAGGVPFESLTARGGYRARVVTLDAQLRVDASAELTMTGRVPLDGGGLELHAHTEGIKAALFEPLTASHVDQVGGTIRLDVEVTGALRAPSVRGTASVVDGRLRIVPTGEAYRALNAVVRFDGDRVAVDQLSIDDADGHRLTASGNSAGGGAERSLDISAQASGFHLLHNTLGDVAVNADLHATGSLQAPHVEGRVRIERGLVEVDKVLDRFTKNAYEPAVPAAPGTPGFFSDATIDVRFDMPDNMVLRGRDLRTSAGSIGLGDINITAGGTVHATKAAGGSMTWAGDVAIVRGSYTFQGRQFQIERDSQIRMRGGDTFDPELEITATRAISGLTAKVTVHGTMRRPEISLSSDPPLDPGDVLSLIVFDQPINELGSAQQVSLAERAGTIAAGALATPLADSVARALDLDVFEIRTGETAGAGPTITVGRQVSDRLFVGFHHEFGTEDISQVSFEYQLQKFLRLVSSFGQASQDPNRFPREEAAGLDLFFVIKR